MTKTWKTVRAEAVASGQIDEQGAQKRKAEALGRVRAHRLMELRRATWIVPRSPRCGPLPRPWAENWRSA